MFIVQVHVKVEEDSVQAFKTATIENARHSVKEPGIARFDVIQQMDDPTRFILIEVYRDEDAAAEHKKTDHYEVWKSTVEEMMEEPRYSIKYRNIFPENEKDW